METTLTTKQKYLYMLKKNMVALKLSESKKMGAILEYSVKYDFSVVKLFKNDKIMWICIASYQFYSGKFCDH